MDPRIGRNQRGQYWRAIGSWQTERSSSCRNEKLHVALGAGDRTLHNALNGPALACQPVADLAADALVEGRVAHHPAFAYFGSPDLELGLDQRHQLATGRREFERLLQHLAQRDETGVANDPAARRIDQL